jgi:hypothetical protein
MSVRQDLEERAGRRVGRPSGSHLLAEHLTRALEGAVFPLRRREMVLVARENDAGRMILTMLSGLPDVAFRSAQEVIERLDEVPLVAQNA